jgi:hypothetical protein
MPNPYPQPHSTINQLDADLGQHSDSTEPAPYEVPKTAYGAGIANPLLADLAAGGHKITGLADPAADQDASTKDYVDDAVAAVTLAAVLAVSNVASNKIVTLTDPTGAQDAATKHYVDTAIPLVIPLPRQAAGVPSGAPTAGENGMAIDTTATTGGVYAWSGSAWVKAGP